MQGNFNSIKTSKNWWLLPSTKSLNFSQLNCCSSAHFQLSRLLSLLWPMFDNRNNDVNHWRHAKWAKYWKYSYLKQSDDLRLLIQSIAQHWQHPIGRIGNHLVHLHSRFSTHCHVLQNHCRDNVAWGVKHIQTCSQLHLTAHAHTIATNLHQTCNARVCAYACACVHTSHVHTCVHTSACVHMS